MADLKLSGNCTDDIWAMLDGSEPHVIGLRMDCGDSGVVYLSRAQAQQLMNELEWALMSDELRKQLAKPGFSLWRPWTWVR